MTVDSNNGMDQNEGKKPYVRSETVMSVDTSILKQQETAVEKIGFIAKCDSQGNINEVADDTQFATQSFFGRPFGAQQQQNQKWNPFRKKSGIMAVMHAQTKKNRVVSKHGKINTHRKSEELTESHRFLKDFFTSMIELGWGWTFFSFAASFFCSWLFFAVIWYLVVLVHGDLDEDKPDDHIVCVDAIQDFTSCFLFSLETQHTIGYGGRATTEQCSVAIIVMSIQSIVGVIIQACMAGILFAKFTKPTNRGETIMFSKNALITMRNGILYLVVRLGDIRPNHLIECHVSGHIVMKEETNEGESLPYSLKKMEFGADMDASQEYFQMLWPVCIAHKIDENSPLYEFSPRDILSKQFEIILTIEGTTQETANTIQVRTSYLPNEILWAYRFEHTCVAYDKELKKYVISYHTLNQFVADRTPRYSAKDLRERRPKMSTMSTMSTLSSISSIPENN